MLRTIALLSLLTASSLHAQALFDPDKTAAWLREHNVPALGVGIIRDGKLAEVRVFGELQKGVAAPYDTIFNVASLTKPVVTMLTMQLVAKGQWSLDEPLAKYWVDPDVASDPRHAKLTTRHVLSHQTGFMNWRFLEESKTLTFHADPGTKLQYSGEGFEYLARALEKKFGKPLSELAAEHVFKPLQMNDSALTWTARTDESRFARWHGGDGSLHKEDYRITTANAADNLLTTVEDYGRFAAWVLRGAGLPDALFAEMVKQHAQVRPKIGMTLGWELLADLPGGEYALVHSGGDAGVNTLVMLLPKSKRGLVIFTNSDRGPALYEKLIVENLGEVGTEMMKRAKGQG
jgi:CubicO group peptidase (beta-lactamase class C family)